jgi:spermidine synthase
VLSGAAGLIFEVVWARQLVLVFGNTTQAVSAILTGFFGGMAIGSWVGGKAADKSSRPLRLYAALELTLALVVILTPLTFGLIHEAYRTAFSSLEARPSILALVRFGLSMVALAPATVLLGATLPTLTRHLAREASALGAAFTRLYVANTMGAVFGAAAAGFFLIELLGLSGALLVGAACSATAGIIALLFEILDADATPPVAAPVTQSEKSNVDSRRLALGFAFVSGFTALSYQTLWTRLIASGTGSSTYVFSTILTIFLVGLAMGGVEYKRVRARLRDVTGAIAISQVSLALIALAGMFAMSSLDSLPGAFMWKSLAVVLPATFLMGFSFPASSALVGGEANEVGSTSGSLLAINTLGAIIGTFIVPFVLIPLLGSPNVLALTACINAVTGVVIVLRRNIAPSVRQKVIWAGIAFSPALVFTVSAGRLADPNIARVNRNGGIVYRDAEDEIASVQAGLTKGRKQLWITGFSMTFLTVDAKLMPILPLMLRPESKSTLIIAFGMGSSFRSAMIAGLKTDVVELVPSVPGMFDVFYKDGESFASDPRGRIIIGDGRSHVELTDHRYDIIVVDPPPPLQSSGVSIISSREFYAASMRRLTPSGVMMQWVPWGQSMNDFKAHVRTFRSVFPNVIIAVGPGGNGFYMLGSRVPLAFDRTRVATVLSRPHVVEDISSAYDSPVHTLDEWTDLVPTLVRLGGEEVERFCGAGPSITDDRPLPEYFLLRTINSPSIWLRPEDVRAPQTREAAFRRTPPL